MTTERLYKMQMLGNIKFVGALFVRKMLASKVMIGIMEILLQDPTPEALESLAAFLMVVGPTFDTPEWSGRATMTAVFVQLEKLSKKASVPNRIQCLLKDVLDVRAQNWNDRRPKKIEGPLKLKEVAKKAEFESSGGEYSPHHQTSTNENRAVVNAARMRAGSSPTSKDAPAEYTPLALKKPSKGDIFARAREMEEAAKKELSAKKEARREEKASKFDKEACKQEIAATLKELRVSHDVQDAIARIAEISVPDSRQGTQLCEMLVIICENGSKDTRALGFGLVAGLFVKNHWKSEGATKGFGKFMKDVCEDLKCDVPNLSQVLANELHPVLEPLVKAKVLTSEQHETLRNA